MYCHLSSSIFQCFSGPYILTLKGSENKQCVFWAIYLLTTGAGMAGGWECFVGLVVLVLGPNWWGISNRVGSKVAVGQIVERTRKAAVIALGRHLDQLDISKNLPNFY
jgi:hypothetical protein